MFSGAIRVTSGDVEGLAPKWPVDGIAGERSAPHGEVKRLGDDPAVVEFASGKDRLELAAKAEHRALVTGDMSRLGA